MPRQLDPAILRAALTGLEAQRDRIEDHMNAIRSMLGGSKPKGRRNRISKEGRAKIAAAARRRWAAVKR